MLQDFRINNTWQLAHRPHEPVALKLRGVLAPANICNVDHTDPAHPVRQVRMTVKLAVAGAFHTDFMQPAVEKLRGALASTNISTPRIPVISNVDAQPHSDPDTIRDILARQVPTP